MQECQLRFVSLFLAGILVLYVAINVRTKKPPEQRMGLV